MRFEKFRLRTARVAMGSDYTIDWHLGGDSGLSLPFRRWHVFSYYRQPVAVRRTLIRQADFVDQEAGHVGLYPAGSSEQIHWVGTVEAMHLHLSPRSIKDKDGHDIALPVVENILDPTIRRFGAELFDEITSRYRSTEVIEQLVTAIRMHLTAFVPRSRTISPRIGRLGMHELLDRMHGEPSIDNDVSSLANAVALSTSEFTRQFSRLVGASPYDYLLNSRIELAKHAILENIDSLANISVDCGFYDQSHLNRHFRSRVGMSPTSYRRWFAA